jgi:hypothetical protein
MKQRCSNENTIGYEWYGNSGIRVCKQWKKYLPFRKWALSNGYKDGLTIDRIKNNKGYNPDNCRWITSKEQMRNTSRNVYITFNNKTLILKDCSDLLGISYIMIAHRIRRGWNKIEALTTPKIPYNMRRNSSRR